MWFHMTAEQFVIHKSGIISATVDNTRKVSEYTCQMNFS